MIRRTVEHSSQTVSEEGVSPYQVVVSDGETVAVVPYPATGQAADHRAAFRHALGVADGHLGMGTEAQFALCELIADPAGPHYEEVARLTHGQAIDVVAGTLNPADMSVAPGAAATMTPGDGCPVPGCGKAAPDCPDLYCCGFPARMSVSIHPAPADLIERLYGPEAG